MWYKSFENAECWKALSEVEWFSGKYEYCIWGALHMIFNTAQWCYISIFDGLVLMQSVNLHTSKGEKCEKFRLDRPSLPPTPSLRNFGQTYRFFPFVVRIGPTPPPPVWDFLHFFTLFWLSPFLIYRVTAVTQRHWAEKVKSVSHWRSAVTHGNVKSSCQSAWSCLNNPHLFRRRPSGFPQLGCIPQPIKSIGGITYYK